MYARYIEGTQVNFLKRKRALQSFRIMSNILIDVIGAKGTRSGVEIGICSSFSVKLTLTTIQRLCKRTRAFQSRQRSFIIINVRAITRFFL